MKTATIQTHSLPWSHKRYHWQAQHYWAILKLRRAVVLWAATACLGIYAAWWAKLPYEASVVVKIRGMCPHMIIVGEPRIGIIGHGSTDTYFFKQTCSQCEATNEKKIQH